MLNYSNIRLISKGYQAREGQLPVGVTLRYGKFCPQIFIDGKNKPLGRFVRVEDAERVYLKARIERDSKHIKEALDSIQKMKIRLSELNDSERVAA